MDLYIHEITNLKSLLNNAFGGFKGETANPRGALDNEALHAILFMC